MKPKMKPRGTVRLKVECDIGLSTSAFKFNLRRYNPGLSNKFLLSTRQPLAAVGGAEIAAEIVSAVPEIAAAAAEAAAAAAVKAATAGAGAAAAGAGAVAGALSGAGAGAGVDDSSGANSGGTSAEAATAAHPLAARHGRRTVSVVEAHHAVTTACLLSQPLPAGAYTRPLFGST